MNCEYLISRGTILLGFFTLGISCGHATSITFDLGNAISAIISIGALSVTLLIRNDYIKIKNHDFKIEIAKSISMGKTRNTLSEIANSINDLRSCLREIIEIEKDKVDLGTATTLLNDFKQSRAKFNILFSEFKSLKFKIEILENTNNLKNEYNTALDFINSIDSVFTTYSLLSKSFGDDLRVFGIVRHAIDLEMKDMNKRNKKYSLKKLVNGPDWLNAYNELAMHGSNIENAAVKIITDI